MIEMIWSETEYTQAKLCRTIDQTKFKQAVMPSCIK